MTYAAFAIGLLHIFVIDSPRTPVAVAQYVVGAIFTLLGFYFWSLP